MLMLCFCYVVFYFVNLKHVFLLCVCSIKCLASREASPIRANERSLRNRNDFENGHAYDNSYEYSNGNHMMNGHGTTEPSDDEYIDTVEVIDMFSRVDFRGFFFVGVFLFLSFVCEFFFAVL